MTDATQTPARHPLRHLLPAGLVTLPPHRTTRPHAAPLPDGDPSNTPPLQPLLQTFHDSSPRAVPQSKPATGLNRPHVAPMPLHPSKPEGGSHPTFPPPRALPLGASLLQGGHGVGPAPRHPPPPLLLRGDLLCASLLGGGDGVGPAPRHGPGPELVQQAEAGEAGGAAAARRVRRHHLRAWTQVHHHNP